MVIFEVQGGADKGPDGHRKDTLPIVAALQERGWDAEVLFYSDAARQELVAHCVATADAFLMRVNPGSYEGFTETEFLAMGRELHLAGKRHPAGLCMAAWGSVRSVWLCCLDGSNTVEPARLWLEAAQGRDFVAYASMRALFSALPLP